MVIIIKYIFLIVWTVYFLIGILNNWKNYKPEDWLCIFIIAAIPYVILFFFSKRKKAPNIIQTNIQHPDTTITKSENSYVESRSTIYRTDGQKISDEEVPYLIKTGLDAAIKAEKESSNPKFHRTKHEEELSFQFEMKYGSQIQIMVNAFEEMYRAAYKISDYQEKIKLYEKSLLLFQKAQKFCYSKGKGGTIYFQDTWEHMHNSQNPCFSYADLIEESISQTKEAYEILIPSILEVISQNQNILQKDIYKFLPECNKAYVRQLIKQLEASGKITMEKKGKSYTLSLKE